MRLRLAAMTFAAMGAVALTTAAVAEANGVAYYGLRGSYITTEDGSSVGSMNFAYDIEYNEGFGVAVFLGWVLDDHFRLEAEGGFRSADIDRVLVVRDSTTPTPYVLPGQVLDAGDNVEATTAMVNLYYDIHLFDWEVLPWVGAGAGAAYLDVSIDSAAVPDPYNPPPATIVVFQGKDNTWAFAYQFMAGITVPIGEAMSFTAGYRFFQTEDFVYVDALGEEFETNLTQHSVDLGVQIHL